MDELAGVLNRDSENLAGRPPRDSRSVNSLDDLWSECGADVLDVTLEREGVSPHTGCGKWQKGARQPSRRPRVGLHRTTPLPSP
jgi:hypothetical protein